MLHVVKKTIDELANHIKIYHPELKGFNRHGLYRMKQFYETYAAGNLLSKNQNDQDKSVNVIVSSAMTQLEEVGIKASILT